MTEKKTEQKFICLPTASYLCNALCKCLDAPTNNSDCYNCAPAGEPCCIDCYYCLTPCTLVLDIVCMPCNMYYNLCKKNEVNDAMAI